MDLQQSVLNAVKRLCAKQAEMQPAICSNLQSVGLMELNCGVSVTLQAASLGHNQ